MLPQSLSPTNLEQNQRLITQIHNALRNSGQHPQIFNVKENDLLNIDEIKKYNRSPKYNKNTNEENKD